MKKTTRKSPAKPKAPKAEKGVKSAKKTVAATPPVQMVSPVPPPKEMEEVKEEIATEPVPNVQVWRSPKIAMFSLMSELFRKLSKLTWWIHQLAHLR